jgi:hypothetical protein
MKKAERKVKYVMLVVVFLPILVYAAFQARFILLGPRIWIDSPQDGQTVAEPLVIVEGRAKNVAWISINDRQIFTDENGYWSEKLIVSKGVSIISIMARDRYGREVANALNVFLNY